MPSPAVLTCAAVLAAALGPMTVPSRIRRRGVAIAGTGHAPRSTVAVALTHAVVTVVAVVLAARVTGASRDRNGPASGPFCEAQEVRFDGQVATFAIDAETKHRLLNGLDDIAQTLLEEDAIVAYEHDRERSGPVTTALA